MKSHVTTLFPMDDNSYPPELLSGWWMHGKRRPAGLGLVNLWLIAQTLGCSVPGWCFPITRLLLSGSIIPGPAASAVPRLMHHPTPACCCCCSICRCKKTVVAFWCWVFQLSFDLLWNLFLLLMCLSVCLSHVVSKQHVRSLQQILVVLWLTSSSSVCHSL